MKRLPTLLLASVLTFGLVFAVGCDSTGSSGSTDGESGTVDLRMDGSSSTTNSVAAKSEAVNVKKALVTIDEVALVSVEDSSEGEATDTDTGIQALNADSFEVDLKQLETGLDTSLAEVDIPEGTYGQLRLIVDGDVNVTFDDGRQENVMIASGEQTGLKANFDPFTIESADDRFEVTTNWDIANSLKGNSQGKLVITPKINGATVNVIGGTDGEGTDG